MDYYNMKKVNNPNRTPAHNLFEETRIQDYN